MSFNKRTRLKKEKNVRGIYSLHVFLMISCEDQEHPAIHPPLS